MKIVKQIVTHYETTNNPLQAIEKAARNCYKSPMANTPEEQVKFIRKLLKNKHESPLEFATSSFDITTDRGILAELTRHRLASFCVESTRYCAYTSDLSVILPLDLPVALQDRFIESIEQAEAGYHYMLFSGMSPQSARDLLPTCTACNLMVSANWREWRHILSVRGASGAHPKMRKLMSYVLKWFKDNYPVIVEDLTKDT